MKMKHLKHLLIASTVTALCACNNTKESPVSLQWEMVKNGAAPGFTKARLRLPTLQLNHWNQIVKYITLSSLPDK